MKFIVIGCGSIGKRYIDILLVLGHEVVAYNRGAARRNAVKNKYNIKVYGDLDEILAREQADAALICTPNSLHIENAWSAARHGLHLFIEKPLSHNLDNISEFQKEVLSRELIAHVGSNMRFHFGPAKIYEILQAGIIGRPLWAHLWGGMHLPSWHPDEDYRQMYSAKLAMGGGAVMDFIHELDLALWLFGEPLEVAGMVSHSGWLNIETEDVADGLLRYPKGLQVSLHVDYLQKPFQRGIRIVGDMGWVEWDLTTEQVVWHDYENVKTQKLAYPEGYEHNDMYVAQMQHFIRAIETGDDPGYGLAAGRRALELAFRFKRSSETKRIL